MDDPCRVVCFENAEQGWGEFVLGLPSECVIEYLREIDKTERTDLL